MRLQEISDNLSGPVIQSTQGEKAGMAKGTEKRPRMRRKCKERKSEPRITKSPDSGTPSKKEITPIELLAIILKAMLKDRITQDEVDNICSVYYETVQDWWG
jgi:hypothetical protein